MNMRKKLLTLGVTTSVVGAAGLAPSAYFAYRDTTAKNTAAPKVYAAPAPTPPPAKQVITGKPVQLVIPSLGMDLQIADGVYNSTTQEWTLSKNKAHFATITPQPNDFQGNTFIYGHYRPEVFARLHKIQPGAEVILLSDNGYKFVYTYRDSKVTDPSDTSLFSYQGKPILTLQTCTGAWMQNRQLFTLDLYRVEKP